MKNQIQDIVNHTFTFLLEHYFSNNVVEHINQNVHFNENDRIFYCSAALKSMNIFKKEKSAPILYIHSSSVFSEAVSFWFHGHNCAETLKPFSLTVEFENHDYSVDIVYNKESAWFEVSGEVLDHIWKKTKFSFLDESKSGKTNRDRKAA